MYKFDFGSGYGNGNGNGYGYKNGNGNGYGYGNGSGYGYGYGNGSGYGSGYGDGDGDGNGNGYGYGNGNGYGSGYGNGDGNGNGYGYGQYSKEYSHLLLTHYCGEEGFKRIKDGAVLAFWKSTKEGLPANGGSGGPRHSGFMEEIPGPLELCSRRALHATLDLNKWKGDRIWIVALHGDVAVQDDKLGALKREIICELGDNYSG